MKPPGRRLRSVGDFALILPAAAAVVALVGLVRLGRQFPAASESPGLLVPFLLPVLALALEAGAVVALSASQLRELSRPQASSAHAKGHALATLPLLALFGLVLGAAELIPRGTEHPGDFANDLVRTAQAACGASATVPVPLLGLRVSCLKARRLEGAMPGVPSIHLAMRELTFSADLRGVDIVGLDLTAQRSLKIHLAADRARIAGLAPWSRSPRFGRLGRFAVLAAVGALLWLAASAGLRPGTAEPGAKEPAPGVRRLWQRLLGSLFSAVPGAVVAAAFISLDQERATPTAYLGAAVLGLAALGLLRLLARRIPQIFGSLCAF